MTSSGTIGQTTIDVATTLDHAFRRAGISPAEQTVDQITAARQNLYFYLSSLANLGTSLWTIEESLIGLVTAQKQYGVGVGVVDIKHAVRRTLNMPSGGTAASLLEGRQIMPLTKAFLRHAPRALRTGTYPTLSPQAPRSLQLDLWRMETRPTS